MDIQTAKELGATHKVTSKKTGRQFFIARGKTGQWKYLCARKKNKIRWEGGHMLWLYDVLSGEITKIDEPERKTAKFVGYGGYAGDVNEAMDYLELGKVYEITEVCVGGWRTGLIIPNMVYGLTGLPVHFNEAMFEECDWVQEYIRQGLGSYLV